MYSMSTSILNEFLLLMYREINYGLCYIFKVIKISCYKSDLRMDVESSLN